MRDQVLELVEPSILDEGCALVDVTYRREPIGWVLRVHVDREGGVTVDECARISRRIGDLIEAENLIPQKYTLEVSSPGLDRVLKTEREFRWAMGKQVRVWKKRTEKGEGDLIGELVHYDGAALTLDRKGTAMTIPLEQVSKVRIFVEF